MPLGRLHLLLERGNLRPTLLLLDVAFSELLIAGINLTSLFRNRLTASLQFAFFVTGDNTGQTRPQINGLFRPHLATGVIREDVG
jgi:hypothetical protein